MIQSICIYCGSSNKIPESYKQMAADVGRHLASNGMDIVYGGGASGLMGIVADSARQAGGFVVGYMTHFLQGHEGTLDGLSELHVVDTMHERKTLMFNRADGILVLPGGLGTLDEAFEVMTWKQVGLHRKKIVFLDHEGYWTNLLTTFFDHMIKTGFVRPEDRTLFERVDSVSNILPAFLTGSQTGVGSFQSKWS